MLPKTAQTIGSLVVIGAAYHWVIRPWHTSWGATKEEAAEPLPGDELTPNPAMNATHAITIHASADKVWPWLIQIGRDKGGFYSYAWLENLVGCQLHNAENILPQYQDIHVGDKVWLHPKAPPLLVVSLQQGTSIVLGSTDGKPGSWAFFLRPIDGNKSRLIIRNRASFGADLLGRVITYAIFEPAHFIMERKMLLGIKARAEAGMPILPLPAGTA